MNLRDKKILVTGGNGFLGSYLVNKLLERGVSQKNIFIPRSRDFDLRMWNNCQKVVQNKNIVIHLAAKVGGIGFNRDYPGELFYDNAVMGIHLIEAARQAGVEKFVSVGTVCSYPKFTPTPFKESDLWTGYPEETNAPYGLAKKILLVQSQAYRSQYDFNAIYLLPVNLYGPRDNFNINSSHVIPALINKVAEAKKNNSSYIEVWGTGNATREFLYAEDAAEGIVLASEKYDKSDPVNLGSSIEISIKDLVGLICNLMDFKGNIKWDTSKPDGQPKRVLEVSRAKELFGFFAKTSFENGIKKTIEWYLNKND